MAYLSRYTHRVAIANSRLIAYDRNHVTFRRKDYRSEGRPEGYDTLPIQFYRLKSKRIFSGSRCISRLRSNVLSAFRFSSCAVTSSAASRGTSASDVRVRRGKSISL